MTPRGRHPRGLTLMETMMSLVIGSIVLIAIGSAVLIAGKALPTGSSAAERVCQGGAVADQILSELRTAVHITERTATAVTFTIADRNGDGLPERIRYAWSGVAGDPLTRSWNGGAAATVLEDVHQFSLGYELKQVVEQYPGPLMEGPEQLLSSYDGNDRLRDYEVTNIAWIGQHFQPTLAADAVSWTVTRAVISALDDPAASGDVLVQLRTVDGDKKPTASVLEQQVLAEANLTGGYLWHEITFSGETDLTPGQGMALVCKTAATGSTALVRFDRDADQGLVETYDGGLWWGYDTSGALKHYIYGTVAIQSTQTATRQYVTAVSIALQAGGDAASFLQTSVRTPNVPEVLTAVWEADFQGDPTQLDLDGDAVLDWKDDLGTFTPASLTDGVWQVDTKFQTRPLQDFLELTTVNFRFRNTTVGGDGALVRIYVDWDTGLMGHLQCTAQRQADGTQTFTLSTKTQSGPATVALATIPGLGADFLDVRLVIDPGMDTVGLWVGGEHRGTFAYTRYDPPHNRRWVAVTSDVSVGEFDSISIRVGGSGS